ncbi:MAG TPA: PQQ-binding-like beta-propeller repeat protein, partial [Verrucomicrobiae bacterium]|nr:PQQ-binding-like beta-propeller repeat protein [Verrucomicrobiae bacterium]
MTRISILTVLACLILLSSLVLIPFANADWTMFHADPSHSGAGTGNPTLSPTLLWKYNTGNWVYSSPAVVGGVVYVGSEDGSVYALNAANGEYIWKFTTGGSVDSCPAVVNGVVYIGSWDGSVYALDATNGAQLWNFTTGSAIHSSP